MTAVSYAEERLADVWQEMQPLWLLHWREVALDHETIRLKPQLDAYLALEGAGILHVLVARAAGQVIGYHLAFVRVHMHYADDPHAFTDIYYIHPNHRRGFVGVNLFREFECCMHRRGVKKLVTLPAGGFLGSPAVILVTPFLVRQTRPSASAPKEPYFLSHRIADDDTFTAHCGALQA